jgi:transcriptional regulator with XRE-family HTH domain
MKLDEFKKKLKNNPRFKKAYQNLEADIAFQMSQTIEEFRLSYGMTQVQFARKIGTQQPAIARIENATVIPTLPFLQKIAKAFKTKLILPSFKSVDTSNTQASSSSQMSSQFEKISPYFPRSDSFLTENSVIKNN